MASAVPQEASEARSAGHGAKASGIEASQGRDAPKRRMEQSFNSDKERREFIEREKEKDDFLYVLSEDDENVLIG